MEKAKVASLEAELARVRLEQKKGKQALTEKDRALATTDSWRQQISETLATTEHQFD